MSGALSPRTVPAPSTSRVRFSFVVADADSQPIIQGCLNTLQTIGESSLRIEAGRHEHGRGKIGGTLTVQDERGEHRYTYESIDRLTAENLWLTVGRAKEHAAMSGTKPLIASSYVNPKLADRLREEQIEYVDAVGNAYIVSPPLYLWLRGAKPRRPPERAARAFQFKGLQLIALLLSRPGAVNWPYRRLAEGAGVSLGSVSDIFGDLRFMGYLSAVSRNHESLINRRDLLTQWEFGYASRLRPRLRPRVFRFADRANAEVLPERLARMSEEDVLLGGELAAALMTGHLRPQRATLHVSTAKAKSNVMSSLGLVPDEAGDIEVVDSFGPTAIWKWEDHPGVPALAHPLLVYAELVRGAADDRLRETARRIFDTHLLPVLNDERPHQRP